MSCCSGRIARWDRNTLSATNISGLYSYCRYRMLSTALKWFANLTLFRCFPSKRTSISGFKRPRTGITSFILSWFNFVLVKYDYNIPKKLVSNSLSTHPANVFVLQHLVDVRRSEVLLRISQCLHSPVKRPSGHWCSRCAACYLSQIFRVYFSAALIVLLPKRLQA